MTSPFPLRLLLATFAGWTNRHQAQVIDDLVLENQVLKERLGKKRLRLIVRMATEDSAWGYKRIQGELKKLNHTVARSTIAKTRKDNSIPPSANRATSWKTFLKAHADVIATADFFNVEVWTTRGLVTHHMAPPLRPETRPRKMGRRLL